MTKLPNIPDAEIDRLLAGHAPADGRLEDVAQFLSNVDAAYAEAPTDALESAHVSAMVVASQQLAEQGAAAELDPRLAWMARRKGVVSFRTLAAHKWAAAVAVSVMSVLAYGGAAYAGVLPAPMQEATSQVARQVGVAIPDPHDRWQSSGKATLKPKTNNGADNNKGVNGASHGVGKPSLRQQGATGTVDSADTTAAVGANGTPGIGSKKAANAAAKRERARLKAQAKAAKKGVKAVKRAGKRAAIKKKASAKRTTQSGGSTQSSGSTSKRRQSGG